MATVIHLGLLSTIEPRSRRVSFDELGSGCESPLLK